ncbi:MAG TPA: Ig-like domain-containing protein [Edaphobacter sp.]|jgi:hypothetical protein
MSERIYRLLLRLYPSQFRQSYGDEALQLFRDRLQDETGFLRRSRLWLELLFDLGALHVRGYRESVVVRAAAAEHGAGVPSFASVEGSVLELRFLIWGGFLSLIFCGSMLLALQYGGGRLPHSVFEPKTVQQVKMEPKIVFSYEPADASEGQVVRLHAVVSASEGAPMPTGKVNFLHGWNIFVDGALVNGAVTVEARVPKGKRLPLNALYPGDSNYSSITSVKKDR